MRASTNNTSIIELKDADYLDEPQRYASAETAQTSLNQELIGITYNVYVNAADMVRKETTLVFDTQSEERTRTHDANKRMASWLTR